MPGTIKPLVGFIDATFSQLVAHKYKCKPSHTYAHTCIHPYYHWEHSRSVVGMKCRLCLSSQWPLSFKGCMWVRCCLSISHRLPVDRYYNALCRQRIHWLSYNHPIVSALRDISCRVGRKWKSVNSFIVLTTLMSVTEWLSVVGLMFRDEWMQLPSVLICGLRFTVQSQSLYQLFILFAYNKKSDSHGHVIVLEILPILAILWLCFICNLCRRLFVVRVPGYHCCKFTGCQVKCAFPSSCSSEGGYCWTPLCLWLVQEQQGSSMHSPVC